MSDRTCTVEGCDKQRVTSAKYCEMHRGRVRRYGSPDIVKKDHRPLSVRWVDFVDVGDCWLWTGTLRNGYGMSTQGGNDRNITMHRFIWQELVGPIPTGTELDHRCRVHACVNPDHLEPVSHTVNVQRGVAGFENKNKTHCKWGHEFTPENTIYSAEGRHRECKECKRRLIRESTARYRARKKREMGVESENTVKRSPNRDKTHCKQGHEFTPENTYVTKVGKRACRECGREAQRKYQQRRRAAL